MGKSIPPALPSRSLQSICVIGATIPGLQTLNTFLKVGIPCKIYDSHLRVGGKYGTPHLGYGCPAPTELFMFPELPRMKGTVFGMMPTQEQVLNYIRDYIFQFALSPNIFLGTSVVSLNRRIQQGDWELTVRNPDGTTKTEIHDLVVVATPDIEQPILPEYLKNSDFEGEIKH
eukprot:UN24643